MVAVLAVAPFIVYPVFLSVISIACVLLFFCQGIVGEIERFMKRRAAVSAGRA